MSKRTFSLKKTHHFLASSFRLPILYKHPKTRISGDHTIFSRPNRKKCPYWDDDI